jgi:hypothetical protein
VVPGIINSGNWLTNRRQFLQGELAKDPPAEQRAAIEAELANVNAQISENRRHWWRRLLFGIGGSRPT